jgi:hypothetical protein
MARLNHLNSAKEVAPLGAVVGREFLYEMLRALSSQDEETIQTPWISYCSRASR